MGDFMDGYNFANDLMNFKKQIDANFTAIMENVTKLDARVTLLEQSKKDDV